jgi:endonuclease III related protein
MTRGARRPDEVYEALLAAYGPQRWWPGDTPFEVCVGAILTQSTSWSNVEKAIGNLKGAGMLSPAGLRKAEKGRLAGLVRPSLYYNAKARKLKEFIRFLDCGYRGRVAGMRRKPMPKLREELLAVWGIGPETADSILLYALDMPSFVVDAYTRRIFGRLGLTGRDAGYDELKDFFESRLQEDVELYNEFHALIVRHGKDTCRTKPKCAVCCLAGMCKSRRQDS